MDYKLLETAEKTTFGSKEVIIKKHTLAWKEGTVKKSMEIKYIPLISHIKAMLTSIENLTKEVQNYKTQRDDSLCKIQRLKQELEQEKEARNNVWMQALEKAKK
jgi:hypothetical protein